MENAVVSRLRRLRPEVADGLLAAVLLAVDLTVAVREVPQQSGGSIAISALVILAASAPIIWRRRYPRLVLALAFPALLAHEGLGYPQAPLIGSFVAVYSVGAFVERRKSLTAASIAIAAYIALRIVNIVRFDEPIVGLAPNLAIVVMVWLVGANVRTSRAYAAELEEKAARLEREREERARLAVADERARIARELHDVVAHNVSVMVVQAGGARRVLSSQPDRSRDALESIERTGRQALTEMRRLLGILRKQNGTVGPLEPQPGLDRLDQLVGQMEQAGLPVDVVIEGRPRLLPVGVDLSAYRIIQEALTNTLRHAGPAR
ncbi:MAG TPA: histidine kinase, partial [Actinomycetota bacterium]|nr:histidine kinase [Actinomycetota bacterium]